MTKIKIGQKYRVINPTISIRKFKGKIVEVYKIMNSEQFIDKDLNLFDIVIDELELIKDKKVKGVSKKEDINIRDEKDVLKAFNKFIEKWCGKYYSHLIDSDNNDGQYMRDKISLLLEEPKKESKYKYSREIFFEKYGNDMPYHLRVELMAKKQCKELDKFDEEHKNDYRVDIPNKESKEIEKMDIDNLVNDNYDNCVFITKINQIIEQVNKLSKEK